MLLKPSQLIRKSLPALKAILQRHFNHFIRLRDAGKPCISCGAWRPLVAGHYWSVGASGGTRYHEKNVNGQCSHCNTELSGNLAGYRIGLERKWGPGVFDELDIAKARSPHYTRFDLEIMIEEYKGKVKQLEASK